MSGRETRIDPARPLQDEVRRIGGTLIAGVIGDLSAAERAPEASFHRCRRKLKRLRALITLARPAAPGFWRRENARWRDLARALAGAREAAALIETLDRLERDFPGTAGTGAFAAVRAELTGRHDAIVRGMALTPQGIAGALAAAEAGRAAFAGATLPAAPKRAAGLVAEGTAGTLRRAVAALRKAQRSGDAAAFHELRKAVKAHAAHLELLGPVWPKRMRRRLAALDALGDRLGELNDAEVMAARIADGAIAGPRPTMSLLDKLLTRTQTYLRRRALRDAARLFDLKPRRTGRMVGERYRKQAGRTARSGDGRPRAAAAPDEPHPVQPARGNLP